MQGFIPPHGGYAKLLSYQKAEIEYFVGNAEPAVVVCSPGHFGWVCKIAFQVVSIQGMTSRPGVLHVRSSPWGRPAHI